MAKSCSAVSQPIVAERSHIQAKHQKHQVDQASYQTRQEEENPLPQQKGVPAACQWVELCVCTFNVRAEVWAHKIVLPPGLLLCDHWQRAKALYTAFQCQSEPNLAENFDAHKLLLLLL